MGVNCIKGESPSSKFPEYKQITREIAQNAKSCSKYEKLTKRCRATCGKPYGRPKRNRRSNNGYAKFWGVNKVHYGLCENGE